jgi:group I intron endonuclease
MNLIDSKLRYVSGIYIITNLDNGKRYVGSSKDIYNRLHEHLHNLNNNKAHNKHFQSSWNKHGENVFIYGILEFCQEQERFEREQYYIDSLNPEYNLTNNVIANFGTSPSQEVRDRISNTLKAKYASGEIQTYRQDHNWIKCYIYNIHTYKLCAECDCKADAGKLLKMKIRENDVFISSIYKDLYCITLEKFNTQAEIKNHVCKNLLNCKSSYGNYLVSEDSKGFITYHKTIVSCAKFVGSSRSTLSKHTNATKHNPYVIKNTNIKVYFLDEFIPFEETAVPYEKSIELLSGNIGEGCNVNTEINSEITQGSESL